MKNVGELLKNGVNVVGSDNKLKSAQARIINAKERFDERNTSTIELMDKIGERELEILKSFDYFSDLIEKIQGRPEFKTYTSNGINLPAYEAEELHRISLGAELLLGGVSSLALGSAGGIAAAGATTSAVMALGTASTGTAIASLSGAAATNATLAALGGGSLAVGGGGVAAGTMLLGGITLGIGLIVGGAIVIAVGNKVSNDADKAYEQSIQAENEVNAILDYFDKLDIAAGRFNKSLVATDDFYQEHLAQLTEIVATNRKVQWDSFSESEKKVTQNTVMLVGLLYKMCQTELVLKSQEETDLNIINTSLIKEVVRTSDEVVCEIKDIKYVPDEFVEESVPKERGLFGKAVRFVVPSIKDKEDGIVKVPCSAKNFINMECTDAIYYLEKAGFSNIETMAISDIRIGLIKKVGHIEDISINGNNSFEYKERFPKEARVMIVYHATKKSK